MKLTVLPATINISSKKNLDLVQPKGKVFNLFVGLLSISCVLLAGAAMLKHEWTYLIGLACCLSPWALIYLVLLFVRLCKTHLDNSPKRNERLVSMLDRLREYNCRNVDKLPARIIGDKGWITDDGIYLDRGLFVEWKRCISFHFLYSEHQAVAQDYLITFDMRTSATLIEIVFAVAFAICIVTGTILSAVSASVGFCNVGFRDDVLSVLLASIINIIQIRTLLVMGWWTLNPHIASKTMTALVSKHAATQSDMTMFLGEHVARE